MPDGHSEHFDISALSEEEKDAYLEAFHEAHHVMAEERESMLDHITSMGNAYHQLAEIALTGNVLGMRMKTLNLLRIQMEALAAINLGAVGLTVKDVKEAEDFSEVVNGILKDDPNFGKTEE